MFCKEEVKLVDSATTGTKDNLCTQEPCRESFAAGENVVLMKLILDQAGFYGLGSSRVFELDSMDWKSRPLMAWVILQFVGFGMLLVIMDERRRLSRED